MKKIRQQKNKIFIQNFNIKFFSVFLLLCFSFALFPHEVRAESWGSNYYSTIIDQMITTIKRQIEGAMLGTLKMAATEMLNSQVMGFVGGGAGSEPLFITDFKEFLHQDPKEKVDLFMNDFFSMTTGGKSASANYVGAEADGSIRGGDYTAYLINVAKRETTERRTSRYDLDQYGGVNALARGDARAFHAFFRNPMNSPYGYTSEAVQMYQEQLQAEQTVAATKALSSGFLPKEQGGRVMSPAATIQAATTNAQNLGNNILAAAQNPGEILSGVIVAMANKMVTNLIQKGVGEIQSKIKKEIRNIDNQVYGTIKQATREMGPAVQYMGNVNKNMGVIIKNTTPPPSPLPPDP